MRKMIFAALIALLPLTLPAAGEARDRDHDRGGWDRDDRGHGWDRHDHDRGWDRHDRNHWRGGSSIFFSSSSVPAYYDYPVAYDYVPAPVYYAPPPRPVYYAPAPRPVYYAPRPVYYAPAPSYSFGLNFR